METGEIDDPVPAPPPGPFWPPSLGISPTKLKGYANCPHRVRLQYLDKVPVSQPFSLFLTQGTIAHNLLAEVAHCIRRQAPLRSEAEMFDRAMRRLPPEQFPSPAAREGAAHDILRWVRFGIGYLDHDAEFLNIERHSKRRMLGQMPGTVLTISTRPDLILLRRDADGERFVEIIDYKTGSQWVDEIPPITMRYVFKELFQQITPDTLSLRMQFTYVYLEHRQTEVICLTPEYCDSAWGNVTDTIARLLAERDWPTTPSHLCNYCPYNGNACHAFREMEPAPAPDW